MKRTFLFILLSFFVLIVHAQDYLINFSGTGSSTTVETVTVENLTQGKSITLSGSKTLHLMGTVTGNTPLLEYMDYPMVVFPNPSSGDFTVQFDAKKSGMVSVAIYDIAGREINKLKQRIQNGFQSFKVAELGNGVYTIQVLMEDQKFTQKVICNGKSNSTASISYNGFSEAKQKDATLKNATIEQAWQYNTGDRLKFQGTSGKYSTIVMDVTTQSKTLSFDFVECTDADGNNYPVVKIGNQLWMAENLKTTKYRTNDPIPNMTSATDWNATSSINNGGYCWYNNDLTNKNTYGALYHFSTTADTRNIAPVGWHIPKESEWNVLNSFLGINSSGAKLKETGFTIVAGGYRFNQFTELGISGYWWSTSELSISTASSIGLTTFNSSLKTFTMNKLYGFSVRCVKGDLPTISSTSVSNISFSTANLDVSIANNGGFEISSKGICWSTSPNPTISNNRVDGVATAGNYKSLLTGLTPNTTYYVRAFVTNEIGTSYGEQISLTTQDIPIIRDGLVAWYPFNGNADDESGNKNDGKVSGANLATDRFGIPNSAYSFNGSSYISVPNIAQKGNIPRSILAWIKTTSNDIHCIISMGGLSAKGAFNITLNLASLPGVIGVMGFDNDFFPYNGKAVNDGSWHLITVTFDGTSLKTYIDGILDNSTSISYNTVDQLNFIGKSNDNGFPLYFNGVIDDVFIYNRTLTQQEIKSLLSFSLLEISTNPITEVNKTSAVSGGSVINEAGTTISSRGVCWSKNPNPTVADDITSNGNGKGNFTSSISGLFPNTTYYVRAYAVNNFGTVYGREESFKTLNTDISKVEVRLEKDEIFVGDSINANLDVYDQSGLLPKIIPTWSTSNPKIAEISKIGKITALSYGEVVITAGAFDKSYTALLKVKRVIKKNYKLPSHDLQKGTVTANLVDVRQKNGASFITGEAAACYADINGDGIDDIFINPSSTDGLSRVNGEIYIYRNGEYVIDNSYFKDSQFSSLACPRKAFTGDFNSDGIPDFFITGHGYDDTPFPGEYTEMLLSDSKGKYDLKEFKEKVGYYHGACSGDIDNDGDLDIFVMAPGKNSYFLINDGKGNFTYSTSIFDDSMFNGEYICELVDINRDGYLDLVLGGAEKSIKDPYFYGIDVHYGSTKIYWGSASYTFQNSNVTHIPVVDGWGSIQDIDAYDLDENGSKELLILRLGDDDKGIAGGGGWYIQIVKLDDKTPLDVTSNFISDNKSILNEQNPAEIEVWMRIDDYDQNGKLDYFSTISCGSKFIRWEIENGKLVRKK